MTASTLDQEAAWTVFTEVVILRTEVRQQFVDLTDLVGERVRRSRVSDGWVSAQSRHTAAPLTVNDCEPCLREDLGRILDPKAPRDLLYGRESHGEQCREAAAHCGGLLLGTSQILHVLGGTLQLGPRQRLLLVELDGPRARTLSIVVMGARGHHE